MSMKSAILSAFLLLIASATAHAEALKIGLNYPQTGRYKDQGLQQRLGAFLAVDRDQRRRRRTGAAVGTGHPQQPERPGTGCPEYRRDD